MHFSFKLLCVYFIINYFYLFFILLLQNNNHLIYNEIPNSYLINNEIIDVCLNVHSVYVQIYPSLNHRNYLLIFIL